MFQQSLEHTDSTIHFSELIPGTLHFSKISPGRVSKKLKGKKKTKHEQLRVLNKEGLYEVYTRGHEK